MNTDGSIDLESWIPWFVQMLASTWENETEEEQLRLLDSLQWMADGPFPITELLLDQLREELALRRERNG